MNEPNEPRTFKEGDTVRANRSGYKILIRDRDKVLVQEIGPSSHMTAEQIAVRHPYYEVWAVRTLEADKKLPDGSILPKGTEILPSSKDWGTRGWSFVGRDALQRAKLRLFGRLTP